MRSSIIAAAVLSLSVLVACGSADPKKTCEDACATQSKCGASAQCVGECTAVMAAAEAKGCADDATAYYECAAADTACKGDSACGAEQVAAYQCVGK
jgi:hypothetical protein